MIFNFELKIYDMQAAMEQGTGPRGSPLICGYTNYHMALESSLAKLKNKEVCMTQTYFLPAAL